MMTAVTEVTANPMLTGFPSLPSLPSPSGACLGILAHSDPATERLRAHFEPVVRPLWDSNCLVLLAVASYLTCITDTVALVFRHAASSLSRIHGRELAGNAVSASIPSRIHDAGSGPLTANAASNSSRKHSPQLADFADAVPLRGMPRAPTEQIIQEEILKIFASRLRDIMHQ